MRHAAGKASIREMIRYGVVGGGLVAIEYAIYVAIVSVRPDAALLANIVSRIVAGAVGFVGHSLFSFATGLSARNALRYAVSLGANLVLASLVLMAALPFLGVLLAKLVSDCAVIAAAYLAGRHLVFLPVVRGASR